MFSKFLLSSSPTCVLQPCDNHTRRIPCFLRQLFRSSFENCSLFQQKHLKKFSLWIHNYWYWVKIISSSSSIICRIGNWKKLMNADLFFLIFQGAFPSEEQILNDVLPQVYCHICCCLVFARTFSYPSFLLPDSSWRGTFTRKIWKIWTPHVTCNDWKRIRAGIWGNYSAGV